MKRSRWLLRGFIAVVSLEIAERVFDWMIGDGDGQILTLDASYFVGAAQLLIGLIVLSLFFSQVKRRIADTAVGVLMVFVTIVMAEAIAHAVRLYWKDTNPPLTTIRFSYVIEDSILGYKLRPDTSGFITLLRNGDTLFHNTLSIDHFGRRVTVNPKGENRKKYAIFLGCSYTFGHSVNDSSTLPSLFSLLCPAYVSYNYGVQGYGTQQLPFILRRIDRKKEVVEGTGIAIYTFVAQHVNRVICDKLTSRWAHGFPYFTLKDDSLELIGTFDNNRWLITNLYLTLNKSEFLSFFNYNIPASVSEEDYKLTAALINLAKTEYEKKFHNDGFYVLIYPGEDNTICRYLRGSNVNVIDLSSYLPADSMKIDGHPTAECYAYVAHQLTKLLCADNKKE